MRESALSSDNNSILVTGYASLPDTEGLGERHVFGLALEVDPRSDVILRAECTCQFNLGRDWVSSLLVGKSLTQHLELLATQLETRAALPAQKSMVRSLYNAHNRYRDFKAASAQRPLVPLAGNNNQRSAG